MVKLTRMLHHAVVILIIACPLGLFASVVATGCRAFSSDLARAGWIGLALMPVLVTGAWEVTLLFWVTATLSYVFWSLHNIANRQRIRPTIQSLLAATFLAALAGLIVRQTGWLSRQEVLALLLGAFAFSAWTSQAVELAVSIPQLTNQWEAWSRKKWATKLGLLVLMGPSMAFLLAWKDEFARNLNTSGFWPPQDLIFPWLLGLGTKPTLDLRWICIWILVTTIGYACVAGAARWVWISDEKKSEQLCKKTLRFYWCWWFARCQDLIVVLASFVAIVLFWVLMRPSGLVRPPADAVDAYQSMDRIVHKMESQLIDVSMLDAKLASDRKKFDTQAFIPWRDKLSRVIDLHTMQVPLVGAESDIDIDRAQLQRGLARTLAFASKCQIANKETDEAVKTLKTGLQMSFESRRGGLMIDELISSACGGSMASVLWLHRDAFSDAQCEILLAEIVGGMAGRDDVASITRRDQSWERAAFGWFGRLQQVAARWETEAFPWTSFAYSRHNETASLRLTAMELLLASYFRQHHAYPDSLDQLVWPKRLEAFRTELMQDPFHTGKRMVYQTDAVTYSIYSVGPNGMDEQGQNNDWDPSSTTPSDDIQLKVMYSDW